jgi:hypothetical protein
VAREPVHVCVFRDEIHAESVGREDGSERLVGGPSDEPGIHPTAFNSSDEVRVAFMVLVDDQHASLVERVESRVHLTYLYTSRAARIPADEGQASGSAARCPAGAFAGLAGEPGERGDVEPVRIAEATEHGPAVRLP